VNPAKTFIAEGVPRFVYFVFFSAFYGLMHSLIFVFRKYENSPSFPPVFDAPAFLILPCHPVVVVLLALISAWLLPLAAERILICIAMLFASILFYAASRWILLYIFTFDGVYIPSTAAVIANCLIVGALYYRGWQKWNSLQKSSGTDEWGR
jgi:hypothetical protein